MLDLHSNYPVLPAQNQLLHQVWQEAAGTVRMGAPLQGFVGADGHREAARHWLSPSAPLHADCVALCAGGNHACLVTLWALDLAGKAIAVDPLTYPGLIAQAQMLGVRLLEVASDADGMLPDALAKIASRVGAIYLVPTVHNPLGYVMPLQRRCEIIEIARFAGVPVIQDDAYHFLEAEPPAHFCSLASDCSFTILSFSKPISPDIRTAFLTFPNEYRERISTAIRLTTSGTSAVFGELVTRCITSPLFARLAADKRSLGARRQAIVQKALRGKVFLAHPASFHTWVEIQARYEADAVIKELESIGIRATSGNEFAPTHKRSRGLRIALSNANNLQELSEAVRALSKYAQSA